jgi:hypothetical protein
MSPCPFRYTERPAGALDTDPWCPGRDISHGHFIEAALSSL